MLIEKKEYLSNGCRLLTNSFEDHNILMHKLEIDEVVEVFRCGQNFWSKDRDLFAFYVAIRDLDQDQQQYIDKLIAEFRKSTEKLTLKTLIQKPDQPNPQIAYSEEYSSKTIEQNDNGHHTLSDVSTNESLMNALKPLGDKIDALFRQIEANEKTLAERIDEIKTDSLKRMVQLKIKEDAGALDELDKDHQERLEKVKIEFTHHCDALTEEIEQLRKENEKLQRDLAWLEKDDDEGAGENDRNSLATMGGMILHFRNISASYPIIVHENAVKYAKRCASKKRLEVFNLMLSIRELSFLKYKNGERSIGGNLKDWFAPRGYEYAIKDSKSTRAQYGQERIIFHNGKNVRLEHHITLFANSGDCVQVYFDFDETNRNILIGYCGGHLDIISRK